MNLPQCSSEKTAMFWVHVIYIFTVLDKDIKRLMSINTEISEGNRCMLLCEMYWPEGVYSSSFFPGSWKMYFKNTFCGYFLSQHISEQLW